MQHILWPSLMLKNIGDSFLVLAGLIQSTVKLILWRPDVVFAKGGYVCLPVGWAAHFLRIPLVIHDSDAYPGLTNRLLSGSADIIATGAPLEYYPYPKEKTHYIGIPISSGFHEVTEIQQKNSKKSWHLDESSPLVVITGGGLGATRINDAIVSRLSNLLKFTSVVLISGAGQYDELRSITPPNDSHFQLHAFISNDMSGLIGAADVVVARAGATTILELAASAKPTILIPNAKLTGGHQLKNAQVYQSAGAVEVVNEDKMVDDPDILVDEIKSILADKTRALKMAKKFHQFAKPSAAKDMAELVLSEVK